MIWYFLLRLEVLITNLWFGEDNYELAESAVFLTHLKMFQQNSLDENQTFPTVSSEMFSKLCYFIWKSAKTGFKIYVRRKLKILIFNGNHKFIKTKELEK